MYLALNNLQWFIKPNQPTNNNTACFNKHLDNKTTKRPDVSEPFIDSLSSFSLRSHCSRNIRATENSLWGFLVLR